MRTGRVVTFKRTESEIVTAICNYLKVRRYFFWRQNNVGVFDRARGCFRTNRNTIKGVPDIFVIVGETTLALEVKSEKGVLSPEQVEFAEKFHKPPSRVYAVARSLNDVIRLTL